LANMQFNSFFFFLQIITSIYTKVHNEGVHPRVETRQDCSTSGPPQPFADSVSLNLRTYVPAPSDLQLRGRSTSTPRSRRSLRWVFPPPPFSPGSSRIPLLSRRSPCLPRSRPNVFSGTPRIPRSEGVPYSVPLHIRTSGVLFSRS